MKSLSIIILLSAALLNGCDVRKKDKIANTAAIKPVLTDSPTVVQIIDTVYNFGKITEGEIVEFSYRFKNTGNYPLIVSNAAASCGCTVPEKPENPIKPGEIGYIKVKFNSDKRPGEVHKTVAVTSNANPPFPELVLRGEVIGKEKE